ncbi:unnamed protein product [Acanthoscelides obtectus]|uniref:Secreted protein n=1 Tax=Acanthoscelides obtectus TaxID=200917 RepID=A0A9P0JP54_ACAOB|nr:unnamed protein product [Acanthoscelides obtectus]CAK1641369.1 hypothetical protein AOBTE_LOCUS12364 [Acanthoscelides obtectus]
MVASIIFSVARLSPLCAWSLSKFISCSTLHIKHTNLETEPSLTNIIPHVACITLLQDSHLCASVALLWQTAQVKFNSKFSIFSIHLSPI